MYVDERWNENNSQKGIPLNAKKLEPTEWNLGSQKKAACDGSVLQNSVQKRQLSMREYWKMFVAKDSVWLAWQRKERWVSSTRQRKDVD